MMKLILTALLFFFSGLAAADERDESIFGGEEAVLPSEVQTKSETPKNEAKSPKSNEAAPQALGLNSENLTIGARLDFQLSGSLAKSSKVEDSSLEKSNFFDVYFDGRLPEQMRGMLRLRFYDFEQNNPDNSSGGNQGNNAQLNENQEKTVIDEAWLKMNHGGIFYTFGKQHLRWGSGRFWNPTDFLAQEVRDPFFDFDKRLGLNLIKLHFPIESLGHNYYWLISYDNSEQLNDVRTALRAEMAFGGSSEAALTFMQAKLGKQRIGIDLSSALGPIDIGFENAFIKRPNRTYYEGKLDLETRELPQEKNLQSLWRYQGVANLGYSFNYTDSDSMTIGAEYFYNQLGYKSRELEFYALYQQEAEFLYLGEQYLAAYLRLPNPFSFNNVTWLFTALRNQSDETTLLRISNSWSIIQGLNADLFYSHCLGEYGEFCFSVPEEYRSLVEVAAAVPGQEGAARLLQPQTISTFGVRLVAEF